MVSFIIHLILCPCKEIRPLVVFLAKTSFSTATDLSTGKGHNTSLFILRKSTMLRECALLCIFIIQQLDKQ